MRRHMRPPHVRAPAGKVARRCRHVRTGTGEDLRSFVPNPLARDRQIDEDAALERRLWMIAVGILRCAAVVWAASCMLVFSSWAKAAEVTKPTAHSRKDPPAKAGAEVTEAAPVGDLSPLHSVPYGYAYFTDKQGTKQKVRAFPSRQRDVHVEADPRRLIDPSRIREAWRLSLANPVTDPKAETIHVTNVELVQTRFESIPTRFICVWAQKGFKEAKAVDVSLKANGERYSTMASGETLDLAPDESQPFLVKITDSDPGIYTFRFSISYRVGGASRKLETESESLFVPNRKAPIGVHVLIPKTRSTEIAQRILRLSDDAFQGLAKETFNGSWDLSRAPESDIDAALKAQNDGEFIRYLRQWAGLAIRSDPSPLDEDVQALARDSMGVGITLALVLSAKEETRGEAIRTLTEYRLEVPEDEDAVEILMGLLVDRQRKQEADRLWVELNSGPLKRSLAYYHSGISYARFVQDKSLEEHLLKDGGLRYPDDLNLFVSRAAHWAERSDWKAVVGELARFCRYSTFPQDYHFREKLSSVVRNISQLLAAEPLPSGRSGLEKVVEVCPDTVVWTLRARPELWPLAPVLAFTPAGEGLKSLRPSAALAAANATAAAGRLRFANRILTDAASAHPEEAELWELLGDGLVRAGDLRASLNAYARAASAKSGRSSMLDERVVAKRIWALCKAKDTVGLERLLERLVSRVPGAAPSPEFRALPPRAKAIVLTTQALVWGDGVGVGANMRDWITLDPGDTFREDQATALQGQRDLIIALDRAGETIESVPHGVSRVPDVMLDRIATAYVELSAERSTTPFRSLDEQWADKRGTPWMMADLMARVARPPDSEAFLIKSRTTMAAGLSDGKTYHVIDGSRKLTSEEWAREKAVDSKGAIDGVYLVPLAKVRFRAEMSLFTARVKVFSDYDLARALPLAATAAKDDPLNVDAWQTLATIHAARGDLAQCRSAAKEGLARDPLLPGLGRLLKTCTEPRPAE